MQGVSARSGDEARPRSAVFLLLGLVILTTYSYLRGQRNEPEWAGIVYYVIDYSDGLIRRGLIGQLFMFVFTRAQAGLVFAAAVQVHRLVCVAMMIGTLIWFWSVLPESRRFGRQRMILVYLTFLASQFLPTVSAINTYLDAYIFLLLLAGFALAAARRDWLAAAVGFTAPFIHEMSVILWASLAIMVFWRDGARLLRQPKTLLMLLAPALGQVVLKFGEVKGAVATQLARAPISDAVRDVMAHEQLGHRLLNEIGIMIHLIGNHPVRGFISVVAFSLPTVIMLALVLPVLDRRARWCLSLAAFTPLIILTMAFDLSRFTVITQFALMLSVLFMASTANANDTPARAMPRQLAWLMAPVLAFGLAMPLVYGYFDSTQIVTNEVLDGVPGVGPHLRSLYGVLQGH